MRFAAVNIDEPTILGNTCRYFDLSVSCRRCIQDCEIGYVPQYAYIFLSQQIIIALDNITALGLDYEQTYGHEQRHVANAIENAKKLRNELEAQLKKEKCITLSEAMGDIEVAELKCESRAVEISIEFLDKWLAWNKLDSLHKLGTPIKGTGYPPIGGTVGSAGRITSAIQECLDKLNGSLREDSKPGNRDNWRTEDPSMCKGGCS